jgi:outer membrane protein assembly factor BamD
VKAGITIVAIGLPASMMSLSSSSSKNGFRILGSVLFVLALLPMAACDSLNPFDKGEVYKPEIKPDIPAEKLYNDGLAAAEIRDFEKATKAFKDINKIYPYSQWSKKALLMETYSHYSSKEFEEASASGKRFLQQYPADADAAYAAYLIASSYYDAVLDVSRDQERAEKALIAFIEVVQRWPKSDYSTDARFKIGVLRDQLAGREMNVGRFYLEKRNYTAAINRFRVVVSQYQTTNQIEEALARLTEAYLALGIINEAETAASILGHNFPDSQWYKDTYALLQKRGTEPKAGPVLCDGS